jgi:copper transporter 1
MLIAMTFNVGFFCAVIGGYILGTLLCSHVMENYAAILHQQRRDVAALARKRQAALPYMNGGGAAPNGNCAVTLASRVSSDEDEAEEKLLMVIEGEGECHCVHTA